MTRYYTRACNFYYGRVSKILVNKKKALPLNNNKEISFDKIEIISRNSKKKILINNLNNLPSLPMRSCKKNTSPSPLNLNIITIEIIRGDKIKSAKPENKISKKRSILTSSDLSICQFLYEQTLVTNQNTI